MAGRLGPGSTPQARDWPPPARDPQAETWLALDFDHPAARRWLLEDSGLDPTVAEALYAENTRPRAELMPEGGLMVLRGVNLNPGEDPEDMISLRVWLEPGRLITAQHLPLKTVAAVLAATERGRGPRRAGQALVQLAAGLVERLNTRVGDLDEALAELEDQVLEQDADLDGEALHRLRRSMARLRRYLAPQGSALAALARAHPEWLAESDQERMREVADAMARCLEDLEAARERAQILQDEEIARSSRLVERRAYTLSVLAALFVPLGFVTGLLGINVGGIPLAESPWGFALVCMGLTLAGLGLYGLMRRLRWT